MALAFYRYQFDLELILVLSVSYDLIEDQILIGLIQIFLLKYDSVKESL